MMNLISLAEDGYLPDFLIRLGIRRLLRRRRDEVSSEVELSAFVDELRRSPLAIATETANRQHYEVPASFFEAVLGPHLKYSCCKFDSPETELGTAESVMLEETCERAEIKNGQRILELGCGWGSLSLWLAEKYPQCEILSVSNSHSQRQFIDTRAKQRGLHNLRVQTADMREFGTTERFDRVVSVEMFEHMRNYELLLQRVASWLQPHGKAFVHIFCHRESPYFFETEGDANWMGRHFFTGGMMPAYRLFDEFPNHLQVEQQWQINGLHYWRTAEAWLRNLDSHRQQLIERFGQDLPSVEAQRNLRRWRIFFLACAELFRYRGGTEWFVGHYRFIRTPQTIEGSPQPSSLSARPVHV